MPKNQPMILILTASLAAVSTVLYNLFQKLTPSDANPALALSVTYAVALASTLMLFVFYPAAGLGASFQKLNWASFALGLAICGVEIGTLLAYRAGWQISLLAIMVNVVGSLALVLIGVIFFKDKLSPINVLGILICIAGLVMVNFKR
jgi:drug/metabolite transporter (DMT)-like permease